MSSPVVKALCRMPIVFEQRSDASMVALLRESGYVEARSEVSEKEIEIHIRKNPSLVDVWVGYSQDRRSSPAWYLAEPGTGLDGDEGWRVGYYTERDRPPERVFPNEFAACAFFIMREV